MCCVKVPSKKLLTFKSKLINTKMKIYQRQHYYMEEKREFLNGIRSAEIKFSVNVKSSSILDHKKNEKLGENYKLNQ